MAQVITTLGNISQTDIVINVARAGGTTVLAENMITITRSNADGAFAAFVTKFKTGTTPTALTATLDISAASSAIDITDKFKIIVTTGDSGEEASDPVIAYEGLSIVSATVDSISVQVPFGMDNNISSSTLQLQRSHAGSLFNTVTPTISAGADKTKATIDLTNITGRDTTDEYLIQIIDSNTKTNRVSVNLASTITSTLTTVPYIMPAQAGSYKLETQQLNGDDFIISTSSAFKVGPKPDTTNSTISIDKPYLVKFEGHYYNVAVKLDNATHTVSDGSYEIIYQANKQ